MTAINFPTSCFKAYDIRGKLGEQLNTDLAWRIGRAFAEYLNPNTVVVGCDMRLSSPKLKHAVIQGLRDGGSDVIDLGMVGTEEVYFATRYLSADGGIIITASHNPADYNGMKLVARDSIPISNDSGLRTIKSMVAHAPFSNTTSTGTLTQANTLDAYVSHLLSYIEIDCIKPLKLVVNAGNGAAGHVIDAVEARFIEANVPIEFIKINHQADGRFPNGVPNPMLSENHKMTGDAVKQHNADLGIAWDGDFDRCFLFDANGQFIEGYYIVGLLAEAFLRLCPGEKVIHDPRLIYNTQAIVAQYGGIAVECKTGHAFIKERMRSENAIYGGEMSAHHYFRDFGYCDSGMIPWLLIIQLLSETQKSLAQMVAHRMALFPASGEINRVLKEPEKALETILAYYQDDAIAINNIDGISLQFNNWRFNLRISNTEAVVRLNVESCADQTLMRQKTTEILAIIEQFS